MSHPSPPLVDHLIGRRVALRHRVGERDGRPLFTDAVGELSAEGDRLVVATRKGPVHVERAAVAAVREVPPAPPRRASWTAVARLENLCADAWPALTDEQLGAWRLRAAGGYTGRANSALAVGDPGMPVAHALTAVRGFAERHGIAPRVSTPIGSPWDAAISGAGWGLDVAHPAGAEVAVLVCRLDALVTGTATADGAAAPIAGSTAAPIAGGTGPVDGVTVTAAQRPHPAWWTPASGGPAPTPAQRHVVDPASHTPDGPPVAFPLATDAAGAPLGRLRAAVVEDHLHVSQLEVDPAARRRGVATALMTAAVDWARGHGARFGVLQVALDNAGARALYERTGWTEHHRYRYLVPA